MLKTDEKILEHLSVCNTGLSDTYFCSIYYKNKEKFMYSIYEKVIAWREKKGGIQMNGIYDLKIDLDRIEYFEKIKDEEMVDKYKNLITEHVKNLIHENESNENEAIKILISKEILAKMTDQSAAYVLRNILFTCKNNVIDWNTVKSIMLEYMPELKLKTENEI